MYKNGILSRGILTVLLHSVFSLTVAQQLPSGREPGDDNVNGSANEIVVYPSAFFERYRPNTALDMVQQLPGFRLNNGSEQRGFGGATGNILIDNRRPSTKQDAPSDILDRIPSGLVDRIELVRGTVRDIDRQGRTVVANVLLRDDVPAAVRWEASVIRNLETKRLPLQGAISMSDRWLGIDYNTGIEVQRFVRLDEGTEDLFDETGHLTETRRGNGRQTGEQASANLNASSWWGNTLLQVNSELGIESENEESVSDRIPQGTGEDPYSELINEDGDEFQLELGIDMERIIGDDLVGKLILIYTGEDEDGTTSERVFDVGGQQTEIRLKETESFQSESITRLEFNWFGWRDHVLQFNAEGAYNLLDNAEVETEDTGSGPEPVFVPGANTRVEELRGDFRLQDTWTLGNLEMELGLGAEVSQLSQSGDEELDRDFFFFKPRALLIHSPARERQSRLRLERQVSQLDFEDFVSATVFEDDDIALGNPNLKPETTWIAEISHERRFGSLGVFNVTLFHHWISDVEDLLPLTLTEEAPGNIGDGRRWGAQLEGTIPLTLMGLENARLDLNAVLQDSTVTDPVSGLKRVLSVRGGDEEEGETGLPMDVRYAFTLDFRQDFEEERVAWGWDVALEDERPLFKVDELDVRKEDPELNLFVETTRWLGLKTRLELNNLLDSTESRDRLIYSGRRGLSVLERRQLEDEKEGREIELILSGTF